jgi:hypothetical protein
MVHHAVMFIVDIHSNTNIDALNAGSREVSVS